MTDSLPDPLTHPECDLRDFTYMPLKVLQLRDSEMAATPNGEVFRAGVLAWCAAWHQVPAASLPDDDATIARLIGMGRDVAGFITLREAGALRGFIKCSDGRLYHPIVAEIALTSWGSKNSQRARTAAAREAALLRRQSQDKNQPVTDGVTGSVTGSKVREGKVREGKKTLPAGAGRVRDDDPDFEAFWKRYQPPKNARKPDTRKAWEQTAGKRPPLADLLRAVDAYRAWVAEEGRKQKRDYPIQHPSTWLRGEVWTSYLQPGTAATELDLATLEAAWGGRAAGLVREIGPEKFRAWFTDAEFEAGPPVKLIFKAPFKQRWVSQHYAANLRRIYGNFDLQIAA